LSPVQGYALIFLLSLAPTFEARYAIVLGIGMGLDPAACLAICSAATLLLAAGLTAAMSGLDRAMRRLSESRSGFWRALGTVYIRIVEGVAERARKYVERWGVLGVALFVAVPLPATGVWSGALASYILGLRGLRAFSALVLGGLASIAITASLSLVGRVLGG